MEPSLREISHILNNGKLMMDIVEWMKKDSEICPWSCIYQTFID